MFVEFELYSEIGTNKILININSISCVIEQGADCVIEIHGKSHVLKNSYKEVYDKIKSYLDNI